MQLEPTELAFHLVPLLDLDDRGVPFSPPLLPPDSRLTGVLLHGPNLFLATSQGLLLHLHLPTPPRPLSDIAAAFSLAAASKAAALVFSSQLATLFVLAARRIWTCRVEAELSLPPDDLSITATPAISLLGADGKPVQEVDALDARGTALALAFPRRLLVFTGLAQPVTQLPEPEKQLHLSSPATQLYWLSDRHIVVAARAKCILLAVDSGRVQQLARLDDRRAKTHPIRIAVAPDSRIAVSVGESVLVFDSPLDRPAARRIAVPEISPCRSLALLAGYCAVASRDSVLLRRWTSTRAKNFQLAAQLAIRFPQLQQLSDFRPSDAVLLCSDRSLGRILLATDTELLLLQSLSLVDQAKDLKFREDLRTLRGLSDSADDLRTLVAAHALDALCPESEHPAALALRAFAAKSDPSESVRDFLRSQSLLLQRAWDLQHAPAPLQQVLDDALESALFPLLLPHYTAAKRRQARRFASLQRRLAGLSLLDLAGPELRRLVPDDALQSPSAAMDLLREPLCLLNGLPTLDSPSAQLERLGQLLASIPNSLSRPGAVSADDLLPMLSFLCLHGPADLPAYLALLSDFISQDKMRGETGFTLTSLSLALHYLEQLDPDSLLQQQDDDDEEEIARSIPRAPPSSPGFSDQEEEEE